ncbi:DUF533 domain-containing protein [Ponticoccus alexandrii]|uniref:DUF533 domain-containing protein n=1 Tax=Ponticoccus alexandrii TaxID=1943633 RepID=A0ABX7F931_9RHOB|nr:DUF533 domain-containing protein [Ponticoccus alexandrii]ETA49191.1 hypothetical protein P279_25995 [Rhodobacteraceae bacterium PD-2]QRF66307.1 DUF533 domain-containing protein [Ponticoccus alexandrii]
MGLMGTLAKMAIGYAAARGVDRMSGGQGLGALLGGGAQIKGKEPASRMQAQMGQAMSGQGFGGAGGSNPMAGMMEMLQKGGLGTMAAGSGGNPLAAMMQQLQSGGMDPSALRGSTGNPGGGLLSQLGNGGTGLAGMFAALGGVAAAAQGQGASAMADSLAQTPAAPEMEKAAALMLRAMIQAAKADGEIDASERAKILETVGADADAADKAFIEEQLAAPVDPEALAADTPEAQRMQVYSASLMTIRVDTQAEAKHLDRLARAMALDEGTVNALHMQMGMQPLYS